MRKLLKCAAPLALAAGMPAAAQDAMPEIDGQAITAACVETTALCEAAVVQALAELEAAGLSPSALNSAVATLAGAVATAAAQVGAPGQAEELGRVLARVAGASTDPAQRQSISRVAALIASGQSEGIAPLEPLAASPA